MSRIAGRFTRVESRRRARKLVLGQLSDLPRKNCWTIAEWAGDRTPDGMQHLLGRAKWDADQVHDEVGDLSSRVVITDSIWWRTASASGCSKTVRNKVATYG